MTQPHPLQSILDGLDTSSQSATIGHLTDTNKPDPVPWSQLIIVFKQNQADCRLRAENKLFKNQKEAEHDDSCL